MDYLHDLAWTCLDWGIDSKIEWSPINECYVLIDDVEVDEQSESDSEWDGPVSDADNKEEDNVGRIFMNEVGELAWATHPETKT